MSNKDDRNFGYFIAAYAIAMLFGLGVWSVIIWAIIKLVTYFTGG